MSELRASASSRKRCMSERCWASRPDRPAAARRGARQDPAGAAVAHRVVHEQARGVRSPPSPLLCCPRLCCLLMRSPFAQHGSHVPERAPGHHSVIVATAPLLCPPPSRGAELNGASGSHGCGVFLRWVLPKLVGFARICASDIDQKFTTILFYLCRRVPARLVELRAAEDSLRHLPVIPRLNRQPKLHRHCRHRVPAHHTPHPASALLCFLPTPCTGSSRGGVRTRWRVWTCAR